MCGLPKWGVEPPTIVDGAADARMSGGRTIRSSSLGVNTFANSSTTSGPTSNASRLMLGPIAATSEAG